MLFFKKRYEDAIKDEEPVAECFSNEEVMELLGQVVNSTKLRNSVFRILEIKKLGFMRYEYTLKLRTKETNLIVYAETNYMKTEIVKRGSTDVSDLLNRESDSQQAGFLKNIILPLCYAAMYGRGYRTLQINDCFRHIHLR